MMIFIFGNYPFSGFFFGIFLDFHQIFRFLRRKDCLPFKYNMMIFLLRKLSGFRIFPDFQLIFRFLHIMYGLLLTYDMMISFSGYFSGFSSNLQISSQNRRFMIIFLSRNLSKFFRIFIISSNLFFYYSLLCSRRKTLSI